MGMTFTPVDVEQAHYTERQLSRSPSYNGRAAHFSEREVDVLILEGLAYFGCESSESLPPPPKGLPGDNPTPHEEVLEALGFGFDYFVATLRQEPRRQGNMYKRMRELMTRLYWQGRDDMERETAAATASEGMPLIFPDGQKPDKSLVYFVASADGPIKIGIANNVQKRIAGLQTAHHTKLELLASCTGGRSKEYEYHQRFAPHRRTGEWFDRHPDILAEITRLSAPVREGEP